MTTFEDIAAELSVVPPGSFVAARNARAKEVDDPELAARVRGLRKPSVAAWVVNVFATERVDQLGEALALAADLREAQADLDAAALSQLNRDRRALTKRLADEAASLAESRGETVTAPTLDAVHQTITAAFYDQDAAAAVASGRLIRALEPGATSTDVADALAGAPGSPPVPRERPRDEVSARRARRDAERTLHDAEKAKSGADRALAAATRDRDALISRIDSLAAKEAALAAELAEVRDGAEQARAALPDADALRDDAAKKAESAAQGEADARRALDDLP